jgi:ubiquinone/menaquinone biosynthesis C-methylase UbiE
MNADAQDPPVRGGPAVARRALSFGGVADVYERTRPGYPADAVAWLAGPPPRRVADVGAGTGKLTRGLVAAGHDVVAVDPSEQMLAQLRAAAPGARALVGRAEQLPLDDGEVEVVTSAQAWHWVDERLAVPEVARVLCPGGALALVWNLRSDEEPWQQRYSEVMGAEENERLDQSAPCRGVAASPLFGPVEHAEFRHTQLLDREGLVGLAASRSFVAVRPEAERLAVLDEVGALFDAYAVDGILAMGYVTHAYRAVRVE